MRRRASTCPSSVQRIRRRTLMVDGHRPRKEALGASGERDPRLEIAIAAYVERQNAGEEIDPLEIIEDQPDLAADILRALETFESITPGIVSKEPALLGTLGDYTLRRQIGRGGMGIVYEAWENSLDRSVALKVLPPGFA